MEIIVAIIGLEETECFMNVKVVESRKQNIFPLLLVVLFISILASCKGEIQGSDQNWLGTYSTDSVPVKGYSIEKAGTMITMARRFTASQQKNFNDSDNYLTELSNIAVKELQIELENRAKDEGFNALIGYRLTITQSMQSAKDQKETRGRGYALVIAQAVPVYAD